MKFALMNVWLEKFNSLDRRQQQTYLFTLIAVFSLILIGGALFMIYSGKQFSTFESKAYGLRISYPSAWQLRTDVAGAVVGFVAPKESSLDIFQENVSIVTQDLTGRGISLQAYGKSAEMQIKGFFKNQIEVEYAGSAYLAGMDAYKIVYRGVNDLNPSLNLKAAHVIFLKNEIAYQLTYTAAVSKFDKYSDVFDKMVSSFKFK